MEAVDERLRRAVPTHLRGHDRAHQRDAHRAAHLAERVQHGGADPGNVISVPQTYNQHYGVNHTAAMPEGLASFFVKAACPEEGVVVDPFAGGGTTSVVARKLGRRAGGLELHEEFVEEAQRRLRTGSATEESGVLTRAL